MFRLRAFFALLLVPLLGILAPGASACEDTASDHVPIYDGVRMTYAGPTPDSQTTLVILVHHQDVGGTCVPSGAEYVLVPQSDHCSGSVVQSGVPAPSRSGHDASVEEDSLHAHVEMGEAGVWFDHGRYGPGPGACAPVPRPTPDFANREEGEDKDVFVPLP